MLSGYGIVWVEPNIIRCLLSTEYSLLYRHPTSDPSRSGIWDLGFQILILSSETNKNPILKNKDNDKDRNKSKNIEQKYSKNRIRMRVLIKKQRRLRIRIRVRRIKTSIQIQIRFSILNDNNNLNWTFTCRFIANSEEFWQFLPSWNTVIVVAILIRSKKI